MNSLPRLFLLGMFSSSLAYADTVKPVIDATQPGWRALTQDDFTKVNSADDTWSWKDGVLMCTGRPVSVMRTKKSLRNFELVVEWMHEKPAGITRRSEKTSASASSNG